MVTAGTTVRWTWVDDPHTVTSTGAPDRTLTLTGSFAFTKLVGVLPVPDLVAHSATMRMNDQTNP